MSSPPRAEVGKDTESPAVPGEAGINAAAPLSSQSANAPPPPDKSKCCHFFCCGYKVLSLEDGCRRTEESRGHSMRVCCCCTCCLCCCSARWGLALFSVGGICVTVYQLLFSVLLLLPPPAPPPDRSSPHCDVSAYHGRKEVSIAQMAFSAAGCLGYGLAVAGAFTERRLVVAAGAAGIGIHVLSTAALQVTGAALYPSRRVCKSEEEESDPELTERLSSTAVILSVMNITFETPFGLLALVSAFYYWNFLTHGNPPPPPPQPSPGSVDDTAAAPSESKKGFIPIMKT